MQLWYNTMEYDFGKERNGYDDCQDCICGAAVFTPLFSGDSFSHEACGRSFGKC